MKRLPPLNFGHRWRHQLKQFASSECNSVPQYYVDESKLVQFCMIYGLASLASCFSYVFREDISILSFGDHSGKVQALRFKNLFYDGFWTGLGIGQPANNQVSWATLKKLDKSVQIEATKKVGFISQIKYIPDLNLIITCTSDPIYSLNFIPIQSDRPRLHISNPEGGFDCFEYHHEMHLIATGGKDRTLRIWQPDRLTHPAMQFHNHGGSVDKVYLVKDHKFQVAISVDALRTIRIFDLKEQSLHQEFHYHISHQRCRTRMGRVVLWERANCFGLVGWINTYHPHCVTNPAVHISVEDLLGAFSKRLTYYRKASSTSDFDRYGAGASTSKARTSPLPSTDEEEGDL